MLKKMICLCVVCFLSLCTLGGCRKYPQGELLQGRFYTLQEAYDYGGLTQADLQTIAYYHNNGIPYPDNLSEDITKSIKKAWAQKLRDDNADSTEEITEELVVISKYYGTYNNCAIIILERWGAMYPAIYAPYSIDIGDVSFNYNYARPQIVVWKF